MTLLRAALVVPGLALIGCGAGQTSGDERAEPAVEIEGAAVAVVAEDNFADPDRQFEPEPVADGAELDRSPIDDLLGFETDPRRLSAAYEESFRAIADAVSRCMAAEGFGGYVAEVPVWPRPEELVEASPTLDLARYGYGPTVVLRSRYRHQLTEAQEPADSAPTAGPGHYLAEHPDTDLDAFNSAVQRCRELAAAEHPPPSPSYPEELAVEINELRLAARSGPDVAEAWDGWSRCMREEGYEVPTRADARGLVESVGAPLLDQLDGWVSTNRLPTDEERARFEASLEEVAALEFRLVELDLNCAAGSDLDRTIRDAVHAAERSWLDANGDRVALYLAES